MMHVFAAAAQPVYRSPATTTVQHRSLCASKNLVALVTFSCCNAPNMLGQPASAWLCLGVLCTVRAVPWRAAHSACCALACCALCLRRAVQGACCACCAWCGSASACCARCVLCHGVLWLGNQQVFATVGIPPASWCTCAFVVAATRVEQFCVKWRACSCLAHGRFFFAPFSQYLSISLSLSLSVSLSASLPLLCVLPVSHSLSLSLFVCFCCWSLAGLFSLFLSLFALSLALSLSSLFCCCALKLFPFSVWPLVPRTGGPTRPCSSS